MMLGALLYVVTALPAAAITLIRDADIEHGLTQLAAPILSAAGLSPTRVRILVVNDSALNAFIIDNRAIFLNAGLIEKSSSPEMLQAVIAHEAAHIAHGHIARRTANMRSAGTAAGLGMALAAVAAAAGGGEAAVGAGFLATNIAQRSFLRHTRAEEASADRSAAAYMRSAGVSPRGLVEIHELFRGQELLHSDRQDPYLRTHPLTRDRIRAAEAFVAAHGDSATTNPEAAYWFARTRGKLSAFRRAPSWTLRRIEAEPYPDVRHMREAVAQHRQSDLRRARAAMDQAIALRPGDAFYHELKGQILLENRQVSAALQSYKTAAELAPRAPLILGGYGRALLAAEQYDAAISTLEQARARDFRNARVLRDLSVAYAKTGQTGMAALATAERYALAGRMDDAGRQAQRAVRTLPRGSAPWQRAQDVLIASEQVAKRRN